MPATFHPRIESAIQAILRDTCPTAYVTPEDTLAITRKLLPHWELPGKLQHVTWHLGDSLPTSCRQQLARKKEAFLLRYPLPWDRATEDKFKDEVGRKVNYWLDQGYGQCLLANPAVRQSLVELLHKADGHTYLIHAYVIMPNHLHLLFLPNIPVDDFMEMIRAYSEQVLGIDLENPKEFWMVDYNDRMIRSAHHHDLTLRYIINNPRFVAAERYTLWVRGIGFVTR